MNASQPQRHQQMMAAYGFGLFPLPRYREYRQGPWRLVRHLPSLADGYVSPTAMEGGRFVLYRGRTPWMSTGLMECESHAYHVDAARGAVVVAGLGLAMYLHAITCKAEVERVVVIEACADVIDLMRVASGWDTWPDRKKILIFEADALDPGVGAAVLAALDGRVPDYLYADIWQRCGDPQAPLDTSAMVRMFQPARAGWWGQELSFAAWAGARAAGDMNADTSTMALDAYFAEAGVPVPVTPGYAAFCSDVIAVNRARRPIRQPMAQGPPTFSRLWRGVRGAIRGSGAGS